MLHDNEIYDVKICRIDGLINDNYNPPFKIENLSHEHFKGKSIASAAVAAHECGHAIQHARAYNLLTVRSGLIPLINIANRWTPWIIITGIFTTSVFPGLIILGIILITATVFFSLVTLTVEFDASKRALNWLNNNSGIMYDQEYQQAKKALWWAATTYVVATIASLGTLLYYLSYLNRKT